MKTGSKEKDLFLKLCRYCAYRERCVSELREKMFKLEIKPSLQDQMLVKLRKENFLNERRYAASFARGKFRNNKWGKNKIQRELKAKQISQEDISYGLSEIDAEEYDNQLLELIHTKMTRTKAKLIFERRKQVADYMARKGYELDQVWDILKREYPDV